ncbi:hypothetical protein XI08_18315 [Bradyrhizobium sp. CCBAU 11361]|nr:hypothetical protein [Bradyrhizobium sp. CCBAU 11361]
MEIRAVESVHQLVTVYGLQAAQSLHRIQRAELILAENSSIQDQTSAVVLSGIEKTRQAAKYLCNVRSTRFRAASQLREPVRPAPIRHLFPTASPQVRSWTDCLHGSVST